MSLVNWKEFAVGELSTDAKLVMDGGVSYVEVTIYVKDKDAMASILAGKVELSLGYTCIYDLTGGETPDGVKFDAQQKDIRVNHCALVERGRAGFECRIVTSEDSAIGTHFVCAKRKPEAEKPALQDNVNEEENLMTIKTNRVVKIADTELTLDEADAKAVQAAVDTLKASHDKAVKDLTASHTDALGVKDAELVTANDTIAELQKNAPTRDSIRAELTECTAIRDTAKSLGIELPVADTDTPRSLKTAFATHKMGDKCTITDDTADETVNAVYDALTSGATAQPAKALDGLATKTATTTSVHDTQLANMANASKSVKG